MKRFFTALILFSSVGAAFGQDPSFSQFFSSPLNINPALTANINADWRLIANYKNQWFGLVNPYMSATISFDSKIMQNKIMNVEEKNNIVGIGGMFLYDQAMGGALKGSHCSANFSYNVKIADNDITSHRLGVGFGASYGRKYVDYTKLDFEEQFAGNGFDTNLPTGESGLSSMKPHLSLNSGLLYSFRSEKKNFDVGIAAFHINTPVQTFLQDDNQRLARRKVAHANFEAFINDRVTISSNAIYQKQEDAEYFSVGTALGYYIEEEQGILLTGGLWYWSNNALIPYGGLVYKNFQLGLSYDITMSKLNRAANKPNTIELSLIMRGSKAPSKIIPCPWK